MKRFGLIRRLTGMKWLARLTLLLAIPTAGTGFTVLAGMLPITFLMALAPEWRYSGIVGGILGMLLWTVAAAGVGVGTVRLFRKLGGLRATAGVAAVGADGVCITHWLGHSFIPFAEIESVEWVDDAVVIRTSGGKSRVLRCDKHAELLAAIEAALAVFRERTPSPDVDQLRVEESLVDWIAKAKALMEAGSFRGKAITREQLLEVVEDPRAAAAQRLGSALALGEPNDDVRVRVRVAIDETADPELARALEEAVAGKLAPKTLERLVD